MQDAVAVGDAVALVNEMRHSTADKTSPFGACGSQLQVFGMGGGEEGFGLWSRSYTEASIARVCQSKAGRHHPAIGSVGSGNLHLNFGRRSSVLSLLPGFYFSFRFSFCTLLILFCHFLFAGHVATGQGNELD